jgi:hypothetical protein
MMNAMARARDPRHHNCVERQAYTSAGTFALACALALGVQAVGGPAWSLVVLGVTGVVVILALTLAWDTEERRRARLTERDRRAGRW